MGLQRVRHDRATDIHKALPGPVSGFHVGWIKTRVLFKEYLWKEVLTLDEFIKALLSFPVSWYPAMLSLNFPFLNSKHYTDNRYLSVMSPWKTRKPKVNGFSTFLIRKANDSTLLQKTTHFHFILPSNSPWIKQTTSTNVRKKTLSSFKMHPHEQFSIQITNFLLSLAGYWFGFTFKKWYLIYYTYFQNSIYPKTKPNENK